MIAPNKAITIEESALGRTPHVLAQGPAPIDLVRLYEVVADHFDSVDQFLLALDILFVLERIDVDVSTRRVIYAD